MIKLVDRCGVDYKKQRLTYLPTDENLLQRFPFDSARKRMTTILNLPDNEASRSEHGYTKRLHCKGASELILEQCEFYLDSEGNKVKLSDEFK